MAAQWQRIAQQEAFVGRAGDVGDDLGSGLVARSIVQDLMRLSFLIERCYAPYRKWFGTAFGKLRCGPVLAPLLAAVLQAPDWRERESRLAHTYAAVVTLHNNLGVTKAQEPAVSPYHTRPYLVIHADRVAASLLATIQDPAVRALPLYGAVDQLCDSTDLLAYPERRARLRTLYIGTAPPPRQKGSVWVDGIGGSAYATPTLSVNRATAPERKARRRRYHPKVHWRATGGGGHDSQAGRLGWGRGEALGNKLRE